MNYRKTQTSVLAIFAVVVVAFGILAKANIVQASVGQTSGSVNQSFFQEITGFWQGIQQWASSWFVSGKPASTPTSSSTQTEASSSAHLDLTADQAELEPLIQQALSKTHMPVIYTTQYLTTRILEQPIYTTNATTTTNTTNTTIDNTTPINLAGDPNTVAGTLPVLNGGTGLFSYNPGDILYAPSSNKLAARGIGTSGQILTAVAGLPSWQTLSAVSVPSFTVNPAGTNPIGITPTVTGGATFSGQITSAPLTIDRTWTFPDQTGMVCLTTGNCLIAGTGVSSAGTSNYIAKFQTPTDLQNSLLYDDGTHVGIGTSSPAYKLDVNGTLRSVGAATFGGSVTISNYSTANGLLYTNGAGVLAQTAQGPVGTLLHGNDGSGAPSFSAVDLTADVANILPINHGGTNGNASPTAGAIAYGNGSSYAFMSANPTSGLCLTSGGAGSPTWANCAGVSGNLWQNLSGAIVPLNTTQDFLIGGQSTASADFAFVNVNSGTPNFQIGGNNVLSANTLGNGVVNSSLTKVGALTTGLIATGFGTINTNNTISTTNTITGNNLIASALNTAGGVVYTDGAGQLYTTVAGSAAQCLISGGTGAPSWGNCAGSAGIVWQSLNGAIVPLNSTQDFFVGGQSTASAQFAVNASNGNLAMNGNLTALGSLTASGASLSSSLWVGTAGNQLQVNSLGELDMVYTGNSGNLTGQGAFTLDNTNNIGNGLGLITNASDSAQGDLVNIAVNNRNFQNAGLHLSYYGNRNALEIVNNGNNSASNALAVTGNNINDSTLGIIGYELGKGTIKISHYRPAGLNDNNAAGISIDLRGAGTAAQGLYVNSTEVGGTTGDLLRLRNQSIDKFFVDYQGNVTQGGYGYNTTYTKYGNTTGDQFFVGTNGAFKVARAAGNSEAFRVQINGDTQGRWLGTSDGSLKWGSGSLAQDVTLYRTGVGILALNGGITLNNTNGLYDTVIKGSTDSNLFYANATLDKIGIGTSNPVGAFHISKNGTGNAALIVNQLDNTSNIISASVSGSLKFAVDPTGNLISAVDAGWQPVSDSTHALQIQNSSGTPIVNFDTTNGRVGIGTATPSGALQVTSGTVSIGAVATDSLFVATNGALKLTRTSANSEALRTVVNGDSQGRLLITSDGQVKWGSGALAQDVVLQRGGVGQLLLTGGMTFNNTNGAYDTVIKGSTDSNLFYANASLDKIGVGLSNPIGAFQISKDGTGNADLIVNQTGSADILTASASGATKFTVDASGNLISAAGAGWKPLTDSLAALQIRNSNGTSIMNFDTTNNRVGIGTATPSGALQVSSGTVAFGAATTDQFFVAANGAFKVTRSSANSEAFRTQVNGDSQGRILVTSDGQMKWGSGALAQDIVLQRGSAGQLLMTGGFVINNGNGSVDTVIKGSTDSNLFYASASLDKIGIGISNPVGAFHISKNGGGNADLIVNQTDGVSNIFTASSSGVTKMVVDHSGNLGIGTNVFGASAASTIGIAGSTKPTTTIAGAQLWSENVAGTNELRVMDSAGNVTTLSPHNFSAIPEGRSEPMAWSFYSERNQLALNVDMLKTVRLVEALSGVQLANLKDLNTGSYLPSSVPDSTIGLIATQSPILANVNALITDTNNQLSDQVVHKSDINSYATWSNQVWNFVSQVVFQLQVTFQQEANFLGNAVFHNSVALNQDTAGKIVAPAGATKIKVSFSQTLTSTPIVYLSPIQTIAGGYSLSDVTTKDFTITLNQAQANEIQMNWLAVLQATNANGGAPQTQVIETANPVTPTLTPAAVASPTPTASPTLAVTPIPTPTTSPSVSPTPSPSESPVISGTVAGAATSSGSVASGSAVVTP